MDFITDRVRSSREGYVLTRVCPSVHNWGRGVPQPGPDGGIPQPGPDGGGGTPIQPWRGVPHPALDKGSTPIQPWMGVHHLRYPPPPPGQDRGVPLSLDGGYPSQVRTE